LALEANSGATLPCCDLGGLVLLLATNDFVEARSVPHVSNVNQDTLLELLLANDFVHRHTHTAGGHVEDHTSTPMIVLERHAVVNSRVGHDVDIVATLEVMHVCGEAGKTISAVGTCELITGVATETMGVRHVGSRIGIAASH
jgi:hypothetical protein